MTKVTLRGRPGLRVGLVPGVLVVLVATAVAGAAGFLARQEAGQTSWSVKARKYAFEPGRIEVREGDLVQIVLSSEDIPHSFTIDAYRISKQARPGHAVRFEFLADRPGSFPYYCDLKADDGCRRMRGELVVRPR